MDLCPIRAIAGRRITNYAVRFFRLNSRHPENIKIGKDSLFVSFYPPKKYVSGIVGQGKSMHPKGQIA